MVTITTPIYYLFHPQELRSIIQWKVWHNPVHERDEKLETETEKICFHFLKLTSRSFSAVILELHPELLLPVCLFYLILRGLDTIEDDTSIPLKTKEPLLRNFHNFLDEDGWSFNGNRPEEKDRELLVQFHNGLTRLFVEAGFANPALLNRPELYISMGLFLQKTNIIRDVKEDHVDKRCFWPKEIWSKHVDQFEDLFKPENRTVALNCNAEMILNALDHADECLFYLAGLKEQSIFNFCAIPQSMAIATLELCFRNEAIFERNVKITKGIACQLMVQSTQNVRVFCDVFKLYIRKIHKKNTPKDPNFLKISVVCGKVEKFIESIFPSQTAEQAHFRAKQQKTSEETEQARLDAEARQDTMYIMFALFGILSVLTAVMVCSKTKFTVNIGTVWLKGLQIFAAWLFGARFDLAFKQLKQGNFRPPPRFLEHQEL
ncbi:farnesyl-diphosphate farnesyltransferase [Paracoccidioides lutzii Pb01]|uniref:Farnesyl-diphosphate farnesyltransferase n=1 Tax=Paracoccidioides lutzii (strain ATCC MYA-826 / Pb01) TaxID=502779 RepID=A0A0A2UYM1_PARBA|nr:farnesyl-diphosphate farnesyltransferase [Paracoccidioides lutzii Pb01]KGQ00656.1 farnesyl-diphosphate farnesyltransferase [Paracoccidioides lutzii Pb01]